MRPGRGRNRLPPAWPSPAAVARGVTGLLAAVLLAGPPGARAQQQTVGVFVDDPRAFPGYTLLAPMRSTSTWLIDNHGRAVHSWASTAQPGAAVYLTPQGDLLRTEQVGNMKFTAGGAGGRIRVLDWDGAVRWEFVHSSPQHLQHHDAKMLPSGNVLLIAWELKTRAEAEAAGRDPALLRDGELWPDALLELQPDGAGGAAVVWEWHLWDHLVQDRFPSGGNYGMVADRPELVDINFTTGNPAGSGADWTHANSVAYNPELDQVVLSAHNLSEIWVIDHSTTTAEAASHSGGRSGMGGDLLYRWGNPQSYRIGGAAARRLYVQHDAQWIAPGLPGAGNLLVFNNGVGRPGGNASSIDELTPPPVDASGRYARTPGEAYGPTALAWTYVAPVPASFFATNISGAERQPNGDTLVCNGPAGTLFEVTTGGEEVWRYVSPVAGTGPITQADPIPGGPGGATSVFKVRRHAADFPGLLGRDLTPGGPVEAYLLLRNAEVALLSPPQPALASIFTASGLSTLDPAGDLHVKPFRPAGTDPDPGMCARGPLLFYQVNSDRYALAAVREGTCGVRLSF